MVQPRIAQFTRACSYDRAGSAFSAPGPRPVTVERIATELHDALRAGGINGPFILVGAASGGNHIRAFADLFPQEVAGLVLIDGDATDVDSPANRAKADQGLLGFVPRLERCREAIAAGNMDAVLPAPPGRPPHKCAEIFFRGFPESAWSPELNAKLLDMARHNLAMWDADISEAREIPAGEAWLQRHRRSLGDRPVRILTSGITAFIIWTNPPRPRSNS